MSVEDSIETAEEFMARLGVLLANRNAARDVVRQVGAEAARLEYDLETAKWQLTQIELSLARLFLSAGVPNACSGEHQFGSPVTAP
jgi:hypothetical protein